MQPYIAAWGGNLWRYTQDLGSSDPIRLEPTSRVDCTNGGHRTSGFDNRGACVAYVRAAHPLP